MFENVAKPIAGFLAVIGIFQLIAGQNTCSCRIFE